MLELNRLYNLDCMEGMKQFPDQYFELAIVDPPYGIKVSSNMGRRKADTPSSYEKILWDDSAPPLEYFKELFRVSKNQIIWGANHFINLIPFDSPCWIVWDKLFSEDVSFASVELAWTSFHNSAKRIQLSSSQANRIHPTQKPVALYRWLLQRYAKPGDKILDTHAGSASSFLAALQSGHDYIGFEIDKHYYQAACERAEAFRRETGYGVKSQESIEAQIRLY